MDADIVNRFARFLSAKFIDGTMPHCSVHVCACTRTPLVCVFLFFFFIFSIHLQPEV